MSPRITTSEVGFEPVMLQFMTSSPAATALDNVANSGDPPRFFSHTKKGEKSLQYIGKQIWDEIPSEIKSSESFNIFKKSYKKLLLETTVETE